MSRRLGESGRVIVRVLISANGRVREAHLYQSSGHDRLDNAALQTVLDWRCQPVLQGGEPQAAWRSAPVDFVLR
jgi:protein TonB